MSNTRFDLSDAMRRIGGMIRLGTIATVEPQYGYATVAIGDLRTRPLPWLTIAAGADKTWRCPSVDEQVLVLSPSGDLANGVIICGAYSTQNPAPEQDPDEWLIAWRDGAECRYNTSTGALTVSGFATINVEGSGNATISIGGDADVTIGGAANIEATGNVNLKTPTLALDGDMTCTGTITADVEVEAAGISLTTHKHGGVQTGTSQTGVPV